MITAAVIRFLRRRGRLRSWQRGFDHAAGAGRGRIAARGAAVPRAKRGAAHAGAGPGAGGCVPHTRGTRGRDGPADPARLGAPLQRRGSVGPPRPSRRRHAVPADARAGVRGDTLGERGARPCARRGQAVAPVGPGTGDRAGFGVAMAERSVSDVLRRRGFRRLVPRPRHPGHDAAAQASFRRTSPPS